MVEIGKMNKLKINRKVDFGVYLEGGEAGEILLPRKYVPEVFYGGDEVEVFVYYDSEDRLVATTEIPHAKVGEFAFLKCKAVTSVGAFLDWGLTKDLLVPFSEQRQKMDEGRWYVVYVYIDLASQRIVASAKVDKFLDNLPVEFEPGEEVDLIIFGKSDLGFKAIVDDVSSGILYKNEVFEDLRIGQKLKGYIKKVSEDGKLDLQLYKPGREKFDEFSEKVILFLKENGGAMNLTDNSSPEEIYATFGFSKKNFKKAIGGLYKKHVIVIGDNEIRLANEE